MRATLSTIYGIYDVKPEQTDETILQEIESALKGGLKLLQIRDKACDKARWPLWRKVFEHTKPYHCQLIINDQVALVEFLNAQPSAMPPGLHLGQGDTPIAEARRRTPEGTIIGITCHNSIELAQTATNAGANYVAFGRFFPSKTKPGAGAAALSTLQQFSHWLTTTHAQKEQRPLIAVIGGIDQGNMTALIDTPANLFAISHGIWGDGNALANFRALEAMISARSELFFEVPVDSNA